MEQKKNKKEETKIEVSVEERAKKKHKNFFIETVVRTNIPERIGICINLAVVVLNVIYFNPPLIALGAIVVLMIFLSSGSRQMGEDYSDLFKSTNELMQEIIQSSFANIEDLSKINRELKEENIRLMRENGHLKDKLLSFLEEGEKDES